MESSSASHGLKGQHSSPDLNSHTEKELQEERKALSDDELDGDEASKLKKESSYTYWVNKNAQNFPQNQNKDLIMPQKIEDPEMIRQLSQQSQPKQGASVWNKGGTW